MADPAAGRLLRRRVLGSLSRFFIPIVGVGEQNDGGQHQKQGHCAKYEAGERGTEVGLCFGCHHLSPEAATLALDTVSFWLILGTTSSPSMTFPNTVWTPFRCLVFCSLRTMKNWLPPVFLPA